MSFSSYMAEREYVMHRRRMQRTESSIPKLYSIKSLGAGPSLSSISTGPVNGGHRAVLKERRIIKDNELLQARLSHVQIRESSILREQLDFEIKFNEDKHALFRNKELSKISRRVGLQHENELMYHRIQKAPAMYSAEACRKWYDRHLIIRPGRCANY
jgi:hypothetical protein